MRGVSGRDRARMPAPTPLPEDLANDPLRPRDLRARGIGTGVLRGRRLQRVTHGAYIPAAIDPSLVDRCRAIRVVVPGQVTFSHQTGADLLGMPSWSGGATEVHITRPPGSSQLRRARVVQHRSELAPSEWQWLGGLAVTTPTRTLLDLSSQLSLDRLVATADHSIRLLGLQTPELVAAMETAGPRRGMKTLREAVGLMDARAESPQESLVRVWCAVAGLPYLEPQGKVVDGGELIATVDLLDREHCVAIEYEGAHHRGREQFAYDIGRHRRLRRRGYAVVQVEASMMSSPRAVVLTIAEEMRLRGWTGVPRTDRLARLWRRSPARVAR